MLDIFCLYMELFCIITLGPLDWFFLNLQVQSCRSLRPLLDSPKGVLNIGILLYINLSLFMRHAKFLHTVGHVLQTYMYMYHSYHCVNVRVNYGRVLGPGTYFFYFVGYLEISTY